LGEFFEEGEGMLGDGQAIEGSEPLLNTAFNGYPRQQFTSDAQAEGLQGFEPGGVADGDMEGFVLFAEGDAAMLLAPFGQEQFSEGEVWIEVVEVNGFQFGCSGQGFEQVFFVEQAPFQEERVKGRAFLGGLGGQGMEEGILQAELREGLEELISHGLLRLWLGGLLFRLDADNEGAHTFVVEGLQACVGNSPPEA